MAGVCKIDQGGNWHSKLVPLNSNSVCYSGLRVFPWYTVRSCLALGRKKRHAGQWFLVVLSVTVETEGKSKVQGGQEMGHSDRRKGEVTVGNSLGFRKRARACRNHDILSVVSCQRFMRAWSEEGEWLGGDDDKVKQQAGAEGAPKGRAYSLVAADFSSLPILHLYSSPNCAYFSSAGFFHGGWIAFSCSWCTWGDK